jgi:hypothetical protein
LVLFAGVLISQFAWAWATPPFRGIDEIDHTFRASSVANGDLTPTRVSKDGSGVLVEVSPGLAADAHAQCSALLSRERSDCVPEATLSDGNVLIMSTAAGYAPAFYAVVGTLAEPWDGTTGLYVMRAVVSLIDALLLLGATWCLMTRSRTAWPLAGLLAALTPMALYTTMLPAPNGVELSAAVLLWCALLGLQKADPRYHGRLWAAAALAGVLMTAGRMTGPVFVMLIVVCVGLVAPRRTVSLVRSRWKTAAVVAAVIVGAALYQVQWAIQHPPLAGISERAPRDWGVIVQQLVLWPFQWIGAFPYRNQAASPATYVATGSLMIIVWGIGLRRGDNKRWVALGIVAMSLIAPFVYTVATYPELGTSWQGRYALPLLVGAPILIGLSLDGREQAVAVRRAVPILAFLSSAAALIHVVALEGRRPASADDPHWHQPAALVLILLAAGAAVAFDRALAWSDVRSPRIPQTGHRGTQTSLP